ncbi:FtsK/SpoIIIE domain-containing protein [Rhodococcus sp. NPDC060176]|uniref:FtsK/SpoIIIE domain-containing protein n=1 Tax=Rhodococcus sp. NPDC060176 TaxID=3347062 RepID=UPI00364C0561
MTSPSAFAPALPSAIAFPENGTLLFDEIVESFRAGKIYIGPQKGGGTFYWDLNTTAHGLIGGRTGAGKSVSLDVIAFLALWCSDVAEIVVCDPKQTFSWASEFTADGRVALSTNEIADAIDVVWRELDRRQSLLVKRGVRTVESLRRLYAAHPEFEAEDGPAPKRLILLFDEIANFWAKSGDEDTEKRKVTARSQMEDLGRLARSLEINMVIAAQRPDSNTISVSLRDMLGFRLCVGPVTESLSKQILRTTHGTRFPEVGTPKGRAWATTDEGEVRNVQLPFLADSTYPCSWDRSTTITGTVDRLRAKH